MPRRSSRRPSSNDAIGPVGALLLIAAFNLARSAEAMPVPWRIAVGLLMLSAALLLVWAIAVYVRRRREREILASELQTLSGDQFEQRVELLLGDLGWTQLQRRGGRGDRGVDLVGQYNGQRYVVQCKRYSNKVAPSHVRDLVGAMHIQKADRALLVTTSGFTAQGYEEARGSDKVELWDGRELTAKLSEAAARRGDPARIQAVRRRTAIIFGAVVAVNLVVVLYAFVATRPLFAVAPISGSDAAPVAVATLIVTQPTTVYVSVPMGVAAEGAAELTPLASVAVVTTGSLHVAPDSASAVVSTVAAGETASLLGRSPDGAWLQVVDARGNAGWGQRGLFQLDTSVEARLPVIVP